MTQYGATNVSFTGDIPGALRRASRPLADAFARTGEVILKRECPVDTGELQESCYAKVVERPGQDLGVELGATAPHAAPVEFGHLTASGTFVPPNPFTRRALSYLVRGAR